MLDDFREWISDNLRYIILGAAVLALFLIGLLAYRLISGSGKNNRENTGTTATVTTGTATQEPSTQASSDSTQASPDAAEPSQPDTSGTVTIPAAQTPAETNAPAPAATAADGAQLTEDDPVILPIVKAYYEAVAAKDTTALSSIVSPWNSQIEKEILNSGPIESYQNVKTYSKAGMDAYARVVFVSFDAKFPDIATMSPTLSALYLKQNEAGEWKVYPFLVVSQEVSDFITTTTAEADVQMLMADIQKKFETATASDAALSNFINSMNAPETEEVKVEEPVEVKTPETEAERDMMVAIGINIRQSPTTDSAIMGMIEEGEILTVHTSADENGWVQITYDAGGYTIEGYCMEQFLEAAPQQSNAANTQTNEAYPADDAYSNGAQDDASGEEGDVLYF